MPWEGTRDPVYKKVSFFKARPTSFTKQPRTCGAMRRSRATRSERWTMWPSRSTTVSFPHQAIKYTQTVMRQQQHQDAMHKLAVNNHRDVSLERNLNWRLEREMVCLSNLAAGEIKLKAISKHSLQTGGRESFLHPQAHSLPRPFQDADRQAEPVGLCQRLPPHPAQKVLDQEDGSNGRIRNFSAVAEDWLRWEHWDAETEVEVLAAGGNEGEAEIKAWCDDWAGEKMWTEEEVFYFGGD